MKEAFDVMGNLLGTTVALTTTDTSTLLTTALEAALDLSPNWLQVVAVTITCEDNDARIAFGCDAAQSPAVGHVLASGSSLRLPNSSMIRAARIISETAGSAATLMVTVEQ